MANGRTSRRRYYRRTYSTSSDRNATQGNRASYTAGGSNSYSRAASNNTSGNISARDVAELVNQVTNLVRTVNNMVESMQAMIELVKEVVKRERANQTEARSEQGQA